MTRLHDDRDREIFVNCLLLDTCEEIRHVMGLEMTPVNSPLGRISVVFSFTWTKARSRCMQIYASVLRTNFRRSAKRSMKSGQRARQLLALGVQTLIEMGHLKHTDRAVGELLSLTRGAGAEQLPATP